eukprot:TRINITY_DN1489_c0_g1_i8.p2 TRINITY_DN1489_c0_g1~~TRINITY_DN1489_c0_g1_i8.p2  ORF type:complete len:124 (-),score=22.81 TRINITY_DN1489_c0_g1_i8:176-547(-)
MQRGLVGSEMCIRDRYQRRVHGFCKELEINLYSGRNIIQKYKKEGPINFLDIHSLKTKGIANRLGSPPSQRSGETGDCPLCLLIIDDSNFALTTSQKECKAHGEEMLKLHEYFIESNLIKMQK